MSRAGFAEPKNCRPLQNLQREPHLPLHKTPTGLYPLLHAFSYQPVFKYQNYPATNQQFVKQFKILPKFIYRKTSYPHNNQQYIKSQYRFLTY